MPDELKDFLESLSDPVANRVWDWLEDDPDSADQMVQILEESHPRLSGV